MVPLSYGGYQWGTQPHWEDFADGSQRYGWWSFSGRQGIWHDMSRNDDLGQSPNPYADPGVSIVPMGTRVMVSKEGYNYVQEVDPKPMTRNGFVYKQEVKYAVLALQSKRGNFFVSPLLDVAEQIALDNDRNIVKIEDVKAAMQVIITDMETVIDEWKESAARQARKSDDTESDNSPMSKPD